MRVPSPQELADRSMTLRSRESIDSILGALRRSFPAVVWLAEQAGVELRTSVIEWVGISGASAVADWVDVGTSGYQLAARQREVTSSEKMPLLARLVQEEQLSSRASSIASYLRAHRVSLEHCLRRVRNHVATAAYDAAFDASSQRRTVFARTLELARSYLRYVLEADEIEGRDRNQFLATRFNIATILTARFSSVREVELRTACRSLLESNEAGNGVALTYYLDGCLWLYDAFDSRESLVDAARKIQAADMTSWHSVAWHLNCSDVWTKLADCATTRTARTQFLQRARLALDSVPENVTFTAEENLRYEMQQAFLSALEKRSSGGALGCKGVRFPFAFRSSHIAIPEEFFESARDIANRLRRSTHAGEYVYRDVTAELLSYLARDERTGAEESIALLHESIRLRKGAGFQRQLVGNRVGLAQAEDQLLLASRTTDSHVRMIALLFLASQAKSSSDNATRLTVLAREIEQRGPYVGALLPVDEELALAIRNGDSHALYERAAREATQSHDLTRIALGGRGGVIALRDSSTSLGQTFVFKVIKSSALDRDRARTESLAKRLAAEGLDHRFGVIDHLSTMTPDAAGLSGTEEGSLVSVRRYRNGHTLQELIRLGDTDALPRLVSTAEFLAFIQCDPASDVVSGVRRSIWETEFGRWLRAVSDIHERSDVFGKWWDIVGSAPMLPRRDAHAMNWLIESGGRLLAVDLESGGWRPFGYELAQLTEDTFALGATDWESRTTILKTYVKHLRQGGITLELNESELETYYAAGILARAVRTLSNPSTTSSDRSSAGNLFGLVAERFTSQPLGELAHELDRAWTKRTGVASDFDLQPLTEPERRRISRAMSHHLRHDESAPVSRDGWIHVEELAEMLNHHGHKVSSSQLLLIAGALGEPRFELDDQEIRASYGHSTRRVHLQYETKRAPEALYHATPLGNLSSILEAQAGLTRGTRQWVHMTDSASVALTASHRQGKPVALLSIAARNVNGLVFASGHTWLAPSVPSRELKILTVQQAADLLRAESEIARAQ